MTKQFRMPTVLVHLGVVDGDQLEASSAKHAAQDSPERPSVGGGQARRYNSRRISGMLRATSSSASSARSAAPRVDRGAGALNGQERLG